MTRSYGVKSKPYGEESDANLDADGQHRRYTQREPGLASSPRCV